VRTCIKSILLGVPFWWRLQRCPASQNGGVGEVSMSWGGSEFSTEASSDSHFTTPRVVYFAASGDTGGQTIYPGVSPNVVSAGGTTINRDSSLATSLVRQAGAEAAVAPVNMSPVPRTRTESLQSLEPSGAHRTSLLMPTPTRGSRCTTAPHATG